MNEPRDREATVAQLEAECVRRADLLMQACGAMDDASGWLAGLEESFASPNRECAQADPGEDNACIDSDPIELEFPDDWCERCYILKCVREARAALVPTSVSSPVSDSARSGGRE